MAKRRRRNKDLEDLYDILTMLTVIFAGYVFVKTNSIPLTVISLFIPPFIFQLLKQIVISRKNKRIKQSGIQEVEKMDGFQFEHYLEHLFKHHGYKVKRTSSRGDYGADLVIEKNSKKIVIQAKRYAKPVGIKAVQETIAAIPYYRANEGWVVATNSFTKSAKELAASSDISLIDREKLIQMILKMNPNAKNLATNTLHNVNPKPIRCSKCGGTMSIKESKYGRFYGCDHFPRCTHKKKLGK